MNKISLIDRGWPLVFIAVVLLCGCKSEEATDKPLTLRMAHVYEVTAPTHAYGTELLSERIREKTNDLDVTVYPGAQLGSESELLEQLVAGELDFGNHGAIIPCNVAPSGWRVRCCICIARS